MANRVNTVNTLGSAVAHITGRLKEYTQKTVPPNLWKEIINTKVDMIHEVLGTKEKAIYKDSETLTSSSYKGFFSTHNASDTIDATRKILHLADVTKASVAPSDNDMINGKVIIHDTGDNDMMENEIESMTFGTGTAEVTLKTALPVAFTIDEFDIFAVAVNSDDNITISGLTCYKYIDQIISIYDSGITDECIDAGTLSNFWGIKKRNLAYNYIDSIVWIRDGEYLRFAKGSNVTSYGTRTMYYTRKPYPVSADADYIDLPPSQMDLLYKLCMLDGLQVIQVPIPDELKSAEGQISAMRSAKEEEIAKYLLNKSDN
jgi:hypothetical protein